MQKIKNLFRNSVAISLALLPLGAHAQGGWTQGKMLAQTAGLPSGSIFNIIGNTMNWLLAILGFIAIIAFVVSGIMYLTSAGDEGQIERAKTGMTYSIIGVIVALMGYVIIQAVDLWLNTSRVF